MQRRWYHQTMLILLPKKFPSPRTSMKQTKERAKTTTTPRRHLTGHPNLANPKSVSPPYALIVCSKLWHTASSFSDHYKPNSFNVQVHRDKFMWPGVDFSHSFCSAKFIEIALSNFTVHWRPIFLPQKGTKKLGERRHSSTFPLRNRFLVETLSWWQCSTNHLSNSAYGPWLFKIM